MATGPSIPFPVPAERLGDLGPEHPGDQKYNPRDGSLLQSHNGGQYPYKDRPVVGQPITDKYQWKEST